MECPSCGYANRAERRFCSECGAPLALVCASCQGPNQPGEKFCGGCGAPLEPSPVRPSSLASAPIATAPTDFVNGRYQVSELIGEGGKKRVYRAHDTLLDRDVAFALIKNEGLDDAGRERVRREARAMGRLGTHPNIVSVLDLGEEHGQSYLVTELMPGGDLTSVLSGTAEHRLPLGQVLSLGQQLCGALEHAHSRGVIHRDLKPGNIWLTADGTAKLGDFGLAVALDQTRLTQPGMMVGTVSYMAPEQAIGGLVDARSDLYALGALLYEMVCGRPPFIGDESVAIITQHLNSPPVAPSWHRPEVPPGLETLILRLLEKDPDKRPASAAEVAAAVSAVELVQAHGSGSAPAQDSPTVTPLYRRYFVGRETELRQLQAAFDAALSGQGGLAAVVGEPGIGKTSLCEHLATYVTVRGGTALIGHCYEEGSLSLPYLPFVEAMRSYVLARDPEGLKSDLGSGAGEVARIVAEVRDRIQEPERPSGDPEEERWRLLQAVTGFLRNASTVQPLLIVLEDLHDADRGTLELLLHLSRNLGGARLLLIGTYRDVEVDRSHPLSSALAELRRGANFSRVPLRGLTPDEVQRMMASVAQQDIPWPLSELVHRQTEGNPLFVQEMLRYLVEEGMVETRDGALHRVGDETLAGRIPEGLRDVIGKRLSRLSDATNQVLAVAAVIGREFRLDVLQRVANLPEEDLYPVLKEAMAVAVLEERPSQGTAVVYRFMHAFFRQTLYEETIAPLRIRRHQQVARALEEVYGRRVEEHAAELAEHYSYSSDPVDLARAVGYGERAAQRATAVFAYGEAVRHLDQAVKVQQVLDPDDDNRCCDLLLALGDALPPAGDPERAFASVAEEAYILAERLDDDTRAGRACRTALDAIRQFAASAVEVGIGGERFRLWAERLDAHARPGTVDRVQAYIGLAEVLRQAGRTEESWVNEVQAFRTAQEMNDDDSLLRAGALVAVGGNAPVSELHLRREAAGALMARGFDHANASLLAFGLIGPQGALLTWGERKRADAAYDRLQSLAERSQDPFARQLHLIWQSAFATWDGRLGDALASASAIIEHGQQSGRELFARQAAGRAQRRALLYLGRAEDSLATVPPTLQLWARGGVFAAQRAIYLAYADETAAATAIIDQFLGDRDFSSPDDKTAVTLLRFLLEASVAAGHREAAAIFEPLLAPLADLLFTEPDLTNCIGRDLGGAARLLGQPQKARGYYEQGIAACLKGSHRPELALCRLELAELLVDEYPEARADALEHLDFAIAEFQAMKMETFLERALRRKLQLQGVESVSSRTSIHAVSLAVAADPADLRSHAAPDGTVTLMFTDIEGSTALTLELGDQRWLEVLRAHHTLIREHVQRSGGFEVKCQGDGFMLAFGSARRALECAASIQQALAVQSEDPPIRVRMGLHSGEALKDQDDFHGTHVVLAARIADQARGGEILVSELLRGLVGSMPGLELREAGRRQLKGLPGRHRLYQVVWLD